MMPQNRFCLFTMIATLIFVVGCERKPTPRTLSEENGEAAPAALSDSTSEALSEIPKENALVATVNGEGLPRDEFDLLYQHALSQNPKDLSPEKKFEIKVNLLSSLIMTRILKQKAMEADLPVEATMVEAAFNRVRENFHFDDAALQKKLASDGYTVDQFKKTLENEIRVSEFEEMIKEQFEPSFTEADLKDWFESHPESYRTAEVIRIAHILVSLPDNPSEEQVQKALDKANWIREQIVSLNADFGEMAARYSDDIDTATAEGYLGDLVRGQAVATFDEAAFALKPGEVSNPVRSYKGFHLIKQLSRNPSRPLTFEEAFERKLLEKDYVANRKTLMFRDWLAKQREEASVEILDPEIVKVPR